jgi:hypothetical protein
MRSTPPGANPYSIVTILSGGQPLALPVVPDGSATVARVADATGMV